MSNTWKDMDEDDRPGYLLDFVASWAKQHDVTCGEDLYQRDDVAEALPEFAREVLQAAGVIDE